MNPHRGSDFSEFLIEENLMTPTPRTDAIAHRGLGSVAYIAEMTSFARQLERENQTFRAAQKACEDCDAPRVDRIAELERELAAEREQLAANHEATKLMGKWLEAERELADRLAEALEDIEGRTSDATITLHPDADAKGCVDDCWEWSEEALAAWKEARSGDD